LAQQKITDCCIRGLRVKGGKNETALTVRADNTALRNNTSQVSAIQRAEAGATDYVPHVSVGQVKLMTIVAGQNRRHGERNALLIKFLFDGCLRVSEALAVRPVALQRTPDGWTVNVTGKGNKPGVVAISASTAAELQSYCYRARIAESERIFPVSRSQAFRIVTGAFDKAGIPRPSKERDHVGAVHILRHSGAIERLRLTGNPRAVQHQLRHKSTLMTMRYLKTLSADESLRVQQAVEFQW
jgi:integrase